MRKIFNCAKAGYVDCEMLIPFSEGAAIAYLQKQAIIKEISYESEGTRMVLSLSQADYGRYRKFCVL